jgi:hypothetical protein
MKMVKPRNYENYIRFELDLVLSCGKLRENMNFKRISIGKEMGS